MKDPTGRAKRVALCGMMAAGCVVILLAGSFLGMGIYAAPMVAGLLLLPIGWRYSAKTQAGIWLTASVLGFLLVPNIEENLMFACLFGCYPVLRPKLQKLPKWVRLPAKLLFFNLIFVGVELAVITWLVPEQMGGTLLLIFFLAANVTFLCYDGLLPVAELLLRRYLGRFMDRR